MVPDVVSICSALALGLSWIQAPPNPPPNPPIDLFVGDPAPKLELARWVKGEPFAAFAKGRIYVVEFWATWCQPCREAMPHLSAIQAKYEKEVDVLGVDVWEPDPADVEPFVNKSDKAMAYRVAVDVVPAPPAGTENRRKWASENGSTSKLWLGASGWLRQGIPAAFVVDGAGRVAWIGDPKDLDDPLAKIVGGGWDLVKEAAAYRARLDVLLRAQPIRARLNEAEDRGDWRTAIRCIDELLLLDGRQFADLAGGKFQTLLLELKEPEKAYAFAREAIDGVAKENASALGQIAYVIVYMTGDEIPAPALGLAGRAARRANEIAKSKRPGILDSLARVQFLEKDVAAAIETQKKAIEVARSEEQRAEFRKRLETYERALSR